MCVKKLNLSPLFTNSLESSSLLTYYYLSDKRNNLIEGLAAQRLFEREAQKTVGALLVPPAEMVG